MKSTWYGIVMAAGVVVGSGGVSAQALPPPIPPPPPYPGTDLDDGVDKVTLILHGVLTLPSFAEPGGWGYELAAAIQGEFPDNTWQAMPVYWGWRADPFANMDEAISCGRSIGVSMHDQGVTKLHLIGHSLGAFVVDGIASGMKQQNASAVIQCTYLDAFTPFDLAEITEHRGELADHADSYYTSGSAACHWFTQSQFDHCVNVDVTALHAGGLGCLSSHAWPHCFYHRTVDVSGGPCDAIVGDHGLFGGFLGMWSTGWNWAW